jgi:hypothetical protein
MTVAALAAPAGPAGSSRSDAIMILIMILIQDSGLVTLLHALIAKLSHASNHNRSQSR